MFIDLSQKITQFVVQEYVNKIFNAETDLEKSFDMHKLIHTFEVVKMAQELIEQTDIPLDEEVKTQILNGALLHDIARCYEYKDGVKLQGFDHGKAGASIIQRQFPDLVVEQKATELHNKLPSDQDPEWTKPVIDYVRDADMLGNIRYQIDHMDLFVEHIRPCCPKEDDRPFISDEIIQNLKQEKIVPYKKGEPLRFLDMVLYEATWIFVLKTSAAFKISKNQNLFIRYRDSIIHHVLPILNLSDEQKEKLKQDILNLFPQSLFEKVFQSHGI